MPPPRRPTTRNLPGLQNAARRHHRASARPLFKGETLRGLLLTSFGFSVFGVKGEQVATVAFIVAGLLALLSIAGLVHAFRTPASVPFAEPVKSARVSQQLAEA